MKPEEKSRQHINGQMLYEGWGLVKPGDYLPQYLYDKDYQRFIKELGVTALG